MHIRWSPSRHAARLLATALSLWHPAGAGESLGQGSLPAVLLSKTQLLRRSCGRLHFNPGCQDLGFFCRSFWCGTLSSSDQASVPSDALVDPRLDSVLMSRKRALGSGLLGCSSLWWAFFALGETYVASLHLLWRRGGCAALLCDQRVSQQKRKSLFVFYLVRVWVSSYTICHILLDPST